MIKKVDRIIYYYELDITFNPIFIAHDGRLVRELFHQIQAVINAKHPSRYVFTGTKNLFINDIGFDPNEKVIWGKLRLLRDDFPELLHTQTDLTREIEAAEEEGIVETSHFLIDYSKNKTFLAMEFNQAGAKYVDLIDYIAAICQGKNWITAISAYHVVQDVLKDIKKRINNFSEVIVKVSKSNVNAVKKIDTPLYEALDNVQTHFEQEYSELRLKFDYLDIPTAKKTRSVWMKIIDKLTSNKKNLEAFDVFKIKAQDSLKRDKLEAFNLLIDKLSSYISVEKREKSRVISSLDIYEKMKLELNRIRPLL